MQTTLPLIQDHFHSGSRYTDYATPDPRPFTYWQSLYRLRYPGSKTISILAVAIQTTLLRIQDHFRTGSRYTDYATLDPRPFPYWQNYFNFVGLSTRNACNERDTVEVISGRTTDF